MGLIEGLKQENEIPIIVANYQGLIIYVNQRFEEVFQWTFPEIVGQPLTIIIPSELHDAHNLGFSRFLMTEHSKILNHPLTLKAVKKDGTLFNAEHLIMAEKINDVWTFGAKIRPIRNDLDLSDTQLVSNSVME